MVNTPINITRISLPLAKTRTGYIRIYIQNRYRFMACKPYIIVVTVVVGGMLCDLGFQLHRSRAISRQTILIVSNLLYYMYVCIIGSSTAILYCMHSKGTHNNRPNILVKVIIIHHGLTLIFNSNTYNDKNQSFRLLLYISTFKFAYRAYKIIFICLPIH